MEAHIVLMWYNVGDNMSMYRPIYGGFEMNILDEFETKLTLYFLKSVKELLFFYELSKDQIYIFNLKTKSLDKACGKKNIYPLIGENSSDYIFYKQSKASDRYGYSTVSCNKINISTKLEVSMRA